MARQPGPGQIAGHVHGHRHRGAAGPVDDVGGGLRGGQAHVGDEDLAACTDESVADLAADAVGGTRDDVGTILERRAIDSLWRVENFGRNGRYSTVTQLLRANRMDILRRNNVIFRGQAVPNMVFAHGFGCD